MDLNFSRFEADARVIALPPDLAVLLVGVVARQAASPTAFAQARLPARGRRSDRLAPPHGAFNITVARMLRHSTQTSTQMNSPFTAPL